MDSDIVIEPRRYKNEKLLPREGVFFVNPTEAEIEMEKMKKKGAESRFLFNSGLYVYGGDKFIAGPALGAPMAALTMEKLIALGAKKIILFGWCGALDRNLHVGDILIPNAALSGEGTSQYYLEDDNQPGPHPELRRKLVALFQQNSYEIKSGRVWSTDAVYREKRSVLKELRKKEGVVAVDMEFSALCSVTAFREVEFAAVLVVSDEVWGESWRPGFASQLFKDVTGRARQLLIDNRVGSQEL